MARITITPVEPHDISAELSARGYTIAEHAPEPIPSEPEPIIHIPAEDDVIPVPSPIIHIPAEDDVIPVTPEPEPIIHIPAKDDVIPVPTPDIHIPAEDDVVPVPTPDIHIPAEALEPTGWRKYARWFPFLVLLARERDIMDLRR